MAKYVLHYADAQFEFESEHAGDILQGVLDGPGVLELKTDHGMVGIVLSPSIPVYVTEKPDSRVIGF